MKLSKPSSTHSDSSEKSPAEVKTQIEDLIPLAATCKSKPTQKLAAAVCTETRDIWGDVLKMWVRQHDQILPYLESLVPSFQEAELAAQAYVNSMKDAGDHEKVYSLHLVKNIAWRLEMARILVNTNIPQFEREQQVNSMLDKAAGRQ